MTEQPKYTRRIHLLDWLNDSDVEPVPANAGASAALFEPLIPAQWGTADFYTTAISLGMDNEETIVQTFLVLERMEELLERYPHATWDNIAELVLDTLAQGGLCFPATVSHTAAHNRAYRLARRGVWAWRYNVTRYRIKAGAKRLWRPVIAFFDAAKYELTRGGW